MWDWWSPHTDQITWHSFLKSFQQTYCTSISKNILKIFRRIFEGYFFGNISEFLVRKIPDRWLLHTYQMALIPSISSCTVMHCYEPICAVHRTARHWYAQEVLCTDNCKKFYAVICARCVMHWYVLPCSIFFSLTAVALLWYIWL